MMFFVIYDIPIYGVKTGIVMSLDSLKTSVSNIEKNVNSLSTKQNILFYFLFGLLFFLIVFIVIIIVKYYSDTKQNKGNKLEAIHLKILNSLNSSDIENLKKLPQLFNSIDGLKSKLDQIEEKVKIQKNQDEIVKEIDSEITSSGIIESYSNIYYYNIYGNDGFVIAAGEKEPSNKSVFKVTQINESSATLEINSDSEVQKYALDYYKSLFDKVCVYDENPDTSRHSRIETDQKGILEKSQSNSWIIREKTHIKFQ